MFWIAFLGLSFSWMFTKLGFLSATTSMLVLVIKLLLLLILVGLITAVWFWFRKKGASPAKEN